MSEIPFFISILDIIGIIACSIAASILSCRKGFDLFGVMLVATIASVGGGTIRDILLNNYPIFWLFEYKYLLTIIISSLLTQIFFYKIQKIDKILRIIDALGLAAFTIIGIDAGIRSGVHPPISIIMGTITAAFGGFARDIVCHEIPLILHREIYITTSLIGGIFYFLFIQLQVPDLMNYLLSTIIIFTIRMIGIYKDLQIPKLQNLFK